MTPERAFRRVGRVVFRPPCGIDINMMPVILGDRGTWTEACFAYEAFLEACAFSRDEACYLSIHEAVLRVGESLRRPGVHTEATPFGNWGGGEPWDGSTGIYQASTDGCRRIWDEMTDHVSLMGSVMRPPSGGGEIMEPGVVFWMTDRTPDESLPVEVSGWRQWFRLVSPSIAIWWEQHSTPTRRAWLYPQRCALSQEASSPPVRTPPTSAEASAEDAGFGVARLEHVAVRDDDAVDVPLASMSRKGDCWDNAVAKSVLSTVKTEAIGDRYLVLSGGTNAIFGDYTGRFYTVRRRSHLGQRPPIRFELTCHPASVAHRKTVRSLGASSCRWRQTLSPLPSPCLGRAIGFWHLPAVRNAVVVPTIPD